MAFMISIIVGIIKVITRFVNNCVCIRSRFAFSNRFSSNFSRLNARITGIPVNISLETRFMRSTRVCICLNFGIATTTKIPTRTKIATTATTIIQPIPVFVLTTFKIPPIPMIGAYSTILSNIVETICICWISFVLLVIRDAVEN